MQRYLLNEKEINPEQRLETNDYFHSRDLSKIKDELEDTQQFENEILPSMRSKNYNINDVLNVK